MFFPFSQAMDDDVNSDESFRPTVTTSSTQLQHESTLNSEYKFLTSSKGIGNQPQAVKNVTTDN